MVLQSLIFMEKMLNMWKKMQTDIQRYFLQLFEILDIVLVKNEHKKKSLNLDFFFNFFIIKKKRDDIKTIERVYTI